MTASYDTISDLISTIEVQVDQTDALISDLKTAWVAYDQDDAPGTPTEPGDSGDHLNMSGAVGLDQVTGYAPDSGSVIVNSATSVTLPGNSWAAVPLNPPYEVTVDTVMDIDVLAETDPAEIIGFALFNADSDAREGFDIMKSQGFKVMGRQANTGDTDGFWHVGPAGLGTLQKLESVPVGAALTPGSYTHLLLARDHDNSPRGKVTYANVQLREGARDPVGQPDDPVDQPQDPIDPPTGAGWSGQDTFGANAGETYNYFQSPKSDENMMPTDVSLSDGSTWVGTMQFHVGASGSSVMTQIITPSGESRASDNVIYGVPEKDGHYWPATIKTAAGTLLMVTAGHDRNVFLNAARQTDGDPSGNWSVKDIRWEVEPTRSINIRRPFAYPTLVQHSGEPNAPIYLFLRYERAWNGVRDATDPNFVDNHKWGMKMSVSYDDGRTWKPAVYVEENMNKRPYWTMVSDGVKTHIFSNLHHFSFSDNKIVYFYMQNGKFYDANDNHLGYEFSFDHDTTDVVPDGHPGANWTVPWSAAIDSSGRPCIAWTSATNDYSNGHRGHDLYWGRVEADGSTTVEHLGLIRRKSDSIKSGTVALDPFDAERIVYIDVAGGRQNAYVTKRVGDDNWSPRTRLTSLTDISRLKFLRSRHAEPRLVIGSGINPEGQNATSTPGGAPWEDDFGTTGFVIDSTRTSPLGSFPY